MSLTWVWLKFNCSIKNQNPGAHVKKEILFTEFDLSLTKIQYSTKKQTGTHIQSQSHWFKFDLSLTKIQFSAKNQSQSTCTKSNSIFLSFSWAKK